MDVEKPLVKVYMELKDLHDNGYCTWYTKLLSIVQPFETELSTYDKQLGSLINNGNNSIYELTKAMRYEKYKKEYLNAINDVQRHPILRTYRIIKTAHHCESYLLVNMNKKYQNAISRFRSSSHQLGIETGRHTIPITPLNDRKCQFCNSPDIDDEMHMLLTCSFHKNERSVLYSKIPYDCFLLTQVDLFIKLLSDNDENVIRNVGKYIHTCFIRR